jgi:hypothetical protein
VKFLKIGIRYCGGCNAIYDRKELVLKLIEELEMSNDLEIAVEAKIYDFIILVCGCSNRCVGHENYISKQDKIFISDVKDYSKLLKVIKSIKQ